MHVIEIILATEGYSSFTLNAIVQRSDSKPGYRELMPIKSAMGAAKYLPYKVKVAANQQKLGNTGPTP